MPAEKGAFPGTLFQPVAACHEADVPAFIQVLLFPEDAVGEVPSAPAAMDEGAVVAFFLIAGALAGMMADAGTRPHVVHGPDHGLAGWKDFLDIFQ